MRTGRGAAGTAPGTPVVGGTLARVSTDPKDRWLDLGSFIREQRGSARLSLRRLSELAAVLAPLGPAAASLLLGDRRAPANALRRIDSLILLGPIWAIVATHLGV